MIGRILRRLAVAAAVVGLLAAGYLLWFRDSSLVAVSTVKVTGVERDAGRGEQIHAALVDAGQEMTTLNVDEERLRSVAAGFPEVRSLSAGASFPSTLEVEVALHEPVARIGEGAEAFGVAGDGTVLPEGSGEGLDVPEMALREPPDDGRLGGPALQQVRVVAAAPAEMLAATRSTSHRDADGTVVTLDGGIELRFGGETLAAEKWEAAITVLSDPELQRLDYVDLSSPARPAVGGEGHELAPVP